MDLSEAFHLTRALGEGRDGGQLHLNALTTIQWVHRLGALAVLVWMLVSVRWLMMRPAAKALGCTLLAIVLCQVALGISNLILQLPLALAVLHNAGAALLGVCLATIDARLLKTQD